MSKFYVGDKVVVRSDLEIEKVYYTDGMISHGAYFIEDMAVYMGKTLTISHVDEYGRYRVDEANWVWTDGMLEEPVLDPLVPLPDIKALFD